MKVALVIPGVNLDKSYGGLKDFSNPQPSIGLAYIAAVLKKHHHEVVVVDAYVSQLNNEQIVDIIKKEGSQIVGISVLSTSAGVVEQLSEGLRKAIPAVKIIMGNIHASLFDEEMIRKGLTDYVAHREGEYTMLELVEKISRSESVRDVRGISFLDDGQVVRTEPRPLIEDLDGLPFPDWDSFPLEKYKSDPRTALVPGQSEIQILATRGCPNLCTFCSSHTERSLGFKYRMRDPIKVVDEIEYMHEKYGARAFSFMDLAFPLVKRHALSLCGEIVKRGLHKKIKWTSELRVKPLDLETLSAIKEAGCCKINFGIESGNNRILNILKKNFLVEDVERAVELARRAKLEANGMFMIGLPEETEREIMDTINLALRLKLRFAIFNIFVPYPGCELYDVLNSQGKIHFEDWADFTSYPTFTDKEPVYVPDGLTKAKLMNLQRQAMKKFYLRPYFIWSEIKNFKPSMIKKYWHGLTGILK